MSTYNMNTMITNREMAVAFVMLPFRALLRTLRSVLHAIAAPSDRVKRLDALRAISDTELASQGLTRAEAVNQVLGRFY